MSEHPVCAGLEVVRFAASESIPWANGGGSTRVLVDDGEEHDGLWTYRVSVAELAGAQPFSRFPGVNRHLTFLGPGTLSMSVNGVVSVLVPFDEIRFDGEDDVASEPSISPARDLNVMTRRGMTTASGTQTDGVGSLLPAATAAAALWIALQDGGAVGGHSMNELDVARLPRGRRTRVQGRGIFVELHASPSL